MAINRAFQSWPDEQDPTNYYDYDKQAWVLDGRYVRCGHPDAMCCNCYGRKHEGEAANVN